MNRRSFLRGCALPLAACLLSPVALVSPALIARARADIDAAAPFGIRWGSSRAEVEASGIKLKEHRKADQSLVYEALDVALPETTAQHVMLYFGQLNSFYEFRVLSRIYVDDPAGKNLLASYNKITSRLTALYGQPTTSRRGDADTPAGEFSKRIATRQIIHADKFDGGEIEVSIICVATDPAATGWLLAYRHKALNAAEEERQNPKGPVELPPGGLDLSLPADLQPPS